MAKKNKTEDLIVQRQKERNEKNEKAIKRVEKSISRKAKNLFSIKDE